MLRPGGAGAQTYPYRSEYRHTTQIRGDLHRESIQC
jgi:hypothetical protein